MNTKEILLETDRYIYSNWLTRHLTFLGHKVCARLRKLDKSGSLVVDLGCGSGVHFQFIRYANFIGIDKMPEMVEKAKLEASKWNGRGRVLEADISEIPLGIGSVDSIIASGILEHLENLGDVLSEVKRILVPEGELVVLQSCEGLLYRMGRRLTTWRHIGFGYKEYIASEHIHSCHEVLGILEKTFRKDTLVGIPFKPPVIELNTYIAGRYTR